MVATCKIDHTREGELPADLCRACHPELTPGPSAYLRGPADPEYQARQAAQALRFERKQKRRLRAEVKTWRERVERMRKSNIDPRDIAKAEGILRKAEHDLYLIA